MFIVSFVEDSLSVQIGSFDFLNAPSVFDPSWPHFW